MMPTRIDGEGREIYASIGAAIKARRKALGMTQAALARHIHISRPALANIEVGRQSVLVHVLYDIARALLINPSALAPRPVRRDFIVLGNVASRNKPVCAGVTNGAAIPP